MALNINLPKRTKTYSIRRKSYSDVLIISAYYAIAREK